MELVAAVAACNDAPHGLGEGHPDFVCWKAHQMLLDPASANEFRWVMDEDQILPPDGPRATAERRCMEAVAAVDEARAPTEAERDE